MVYTLVIDFSNSYKRREQLWSSCMIFDYQLKVFKQLLLGGVYYFVYTLKNVWKNLTLMQSSLFAVYEKCKMQLIYHFISSVFILSAWDPYT